MRFITPTDRIALKDAREEGRQEGLKEGREQVRREDLNRFKRILIDLAVGVLGAIPDVWMFRIQSVDSLDELQELGERLVQAKNWPDF